jgi:hypothetical protein
MSMLRAGRPCAGILARSINCRREAASERHAGVQDGGGRHLLHSTVETAHCDRNVLLRLQNNVTHKLRTKSTPLTGLSCPFQSGTNLFAFLGRRQLSKGYVRARADEQCGL